LQTQSLQSKFQATKRQIEERSGTSLKASLNSVIKKIFANRGSKYRYSRYPSTSIGETLTFISKQEPLMADFVETFVIQTDILHICIMGCQLQRGRCRNSTVMATYEYFCCAAIIELNLLKFPGGMPI
jgi:hypothetical protein